MMCVLCLLAAQGAKSIPLNAVAPGLRPGGVGFMSGSARPPVPAGRNQYGGGSCARGGPEVIEPTEALIIRA